MKNVKLMMMTLMMCLVVTSLFSQTVITSKDSTDPTSKWNVVEWNFSDTLITYRYTHPKMIKLVGDVVHKLKVSEIRDEQSQKIYYCQYGDVKGRITFSSTYNIVIFETLDTFNNQWIKITYY